MPTDAVQLKMYPNTAATSTVSQKPMKASAALAVPAVTPSGVWNVKSRRLKPPAILVASPS